MATAGPERRAAGTPAGDTFVVRPDRRQADRMIRLQGGFVVFLALLAVARLALDLTEGPVDALWGFGPLVLGLLGGIWVVVVWRRFRDAEALAEISAWGIRVNDLGRRGWVGLPWEAVGAVREDIWDRVVVTPAAGVGPGTPGTEWPDRASTARRARRRGLLIFVRSSDVAANQVLAAITYFSGGRL